MTPRYCPKCHITLIQVADFLGCPACGWTEEPMECKPDDAMARHRCSKLPNSWVHHKGRSYPPIGLVAAQHPTLAEMQDRVAEREDLLGEDKETLKTQLKRLPQDIKRAVLAYITFGGYGKAAKETGLTVKQVRGRVQKAIKLIKKEVGE